MYTHEERRTYDGANSLKHLREGNAMKRYEWNKLSKLQVGRYAEYFVKMEFTQHGFDVYLSEVDDRGINTFKRLPNDRWTLTWKISRTSDDFCKVGL